jgi:hypothetical protein
VYLGSCFFGYTAENSHHLKARIISKDPLFQEEKIPARISQMSSQFGEIIKKLISVFGEKPTRENAIFGRGTRNPHT